MNRSLLYSAIGGFSLLAASAQAGELVEFSNGEIADAEDVNANFQELAQRIQVLTSMMNKRADSVGEIDFADYGHNYATKTFSVSGKDSIFNSEVWDFTTENKIKVTRNVNQKGLNLFLSRYSQLYGDAVKTYTDVIEVKENGDRVLLRRESNETTGTSLFNGFRGGYSIKFNPGVVLTRGHMVQGQSYSTAGTAELFASDGVTKLTTQPSGYFIDTSSYVENEPVTIGDVEYTDCIKLEGRRTSQYKHDSNFHKISWYCRGEGLVKELRLYNYLDTAIDADFNYKVYTVPQPRGELLQLTSTTEK